MMQDKLKILFEQIKFDEKDQTYFNGATLEKVVVYDQNKLWEFIIKTKESIPSVIYFALKSKLADTFKNISNTDLYIKANQINDHLIAEYWDITLQHLISDSEIMKVFVGREIIVNNNQITIDVHNKAEFLNFKRLVNDIKMTYQKYGFLDIEIIVNLNEEKSNVIKEAISMTIQDDVKRIEFPKQDGKEEKVDSKAKYFKPKGPNKEVTIKEINAEADNLTIEGYIFGTDYFESSKTDFKIITLKVTDYTDSIYVKIFSKDDEEYKTLKKTFGIGKWGKFTGSVKDDKYAHDLVFMVRPKDVLALDKKVEVRKDNAEKKRVELHTHTFMSQMDGLIEPKVLVKQAKKWGHRAIAITDHSGVQAFPDAYHAVCDFNKELAEGEEPFKVIYGTELEMVNDEVKLVTRPNDTILLDNTYVVFDFETTGFNAGGGDQIIEVGAVKLLNGEIIDKFSELIDPKRSLPAKITEVTSITDEMLKGKPDEETVIKRFIEWFKDYPMVAHNAKFDVSFLEMAYQKYNLGTFSNPVLDTLELSRTLDSSFSRHSLSALVKRYDIPFDEEGHHRGDYDAEATAYIFHKMMKKMSDRNIEKISDVEKIVSKEEIYKYGRNYHINLLAKNKVGLKNLFKIISLANTKYLYKTPRILRSEIENLREGLLIGSGCYESEVFIEARSKSDEELSNIVSFYDYVELQPLECYDHLLQLGDFGDKNELIEQVKKIIRVSEDAGKIVVATGDVHHLNRDDRIYREIIVNQKVPGGGRHPLAKSNITQIPSCHFRTTEEMLADFSYLGAETAEKLVITNTNLIADMTQIIEVIIETGGIPFSPKIENSVETVNQLVYDKAHEIYGDPLPTLIEDRIKQELNGIIKGGFDVIYLIAQKLVKKSNDDGYLVGSRGSVGSSFVATLMGITEVNPLAAHYVCPNCKHSIFEMDGESLGAKYSSGYDLPDYNCPKCNTKMNKEGQDMPFATFLGFDADKVPDIDLNFSGEYQWKAHEYTKELFGVDNVYRAGTIGTVADKTAFGFVKGYCEEKNITMRTAEVERVAMGCTGVKRTTGQHPGGIVVIPSYMDVFDFTPFQYPADDPNSLWRTTHFDYHAIDQDVLKLDILGHDDPTILRMLQDLSGINVTKIDLSDQEVMKIFSGPEVLGVTKEQIMCETGTLGIPEFGTKFVVGMLVDTHPKTFSELLKISGLSHGTDVWLGNAQELIKNNICEFKEVIGCRDDIMVYLMYNGLEPKKAFKIMEFVRKGKPSKDPEGWKVFEEQMKAAGIVDWYIKSCYKIKYMFPKAHAAAYVMSALRIAWFKVHHPIWYYCSYFSVRSTDFDIDVMIKGYDAIKAKMIEINNKGYEATNKEANTLSVLEIALEMTARGFKFGNIDLYRSHHTNFVIDDDNITLIPPFRSIEGLGDTVAKNICDERVKNPFISIEDLQKRCKVSMTLIDKMRVMGILNNMSESSQMSLF